MVEYRFLINAKDIYERCNEIGNICAYRWYDNCTQRMKYIYIYEKKIEY